MDVRFNLLYIVSMRGYRGGANMDGKFESALDCVVMKQFRLFLEATRYDPCPDCSVAQSTQEATSASSLQEVGQSRAFRERPSHPNSNKEARNRSWSGRDHPC